MFELSEDHETFRRVVADFAENELAPHVARWDQEAVLPLEAVAAMADLGLFGIIFPEEWGGAGGDFTSLCVAIEEIGRIDQSLGITLSAAVGLGATPIHRFGDDDQKARFLPGLVAGHTLGAFGLTEPDGGSDAAATRTTAKSLGDDVVLNGSKAFITNSGTDITSVITVTARDDDGGISAYLVPAETPGLIVEAAYRKLGWHASDTHGLVLDDLVLPTANRLGEPGSGYRNFLSILDHGRIALAALALGCARACLEQAMDYAKERSAFGRPIGANQAIAFALADLAVDVEAATALTYRAAWLRDQGRETRRAGAIAKLNASEAAVSATRTATQVLGGAGFIEETPIARFYRDAKILEIGEGTSEIQRLVIARDYGLPVS